MKIDKKNRCKTNRGSTAGVVTGLLAIIAVVVILIVLIPNGGEEPVGDSNENTTEEFQTFESEEYGFSITYPADWGVATSSAEDTLEPRFVFYERPVVGTGDRPYDHFVNDSYVGVYPQGIATEGLLGTRGPITEDIPGLNIANESLEYELEDGTPFAWYLRFTTTPSSWSGSGYVWGRAHVRGLKTVCVQNGTEVDMSACGLPMEEGAEIVRRGTVDSADWQRVQKIIKSLTFNR